MSTLNMENFFGRHPLIIARKCLFSDFFFVFFFFIMKKLGHHLGCAQHAQSWVFFQNCQNKAFSFLYYSAHKKATAMVFIWGDRGYPAVRFECKTASERYSVAEIYAKQFWVFSGKITISIFSKNTKIVFLVNHQPNLAQRPFCIKDEWQDILYPLI